MIDKIRTQIDEIDETILALLVDRFNLVSQVGKAKKDAGLPVVDVDREDELMNKLSDLAEEKGLSSDLVRKIYSLVIQHSRRLQD